MARSCKWQNFEIFLLDVNDKIGRCLREKEIYKRLDDGMCRPGAPQRQKGISYKHLHAAPDSNHACCCFFFYFQCNISYHLCCCILICMLTARRGGKYTCSLWCRGNRLFNISVDCWSRADPIYLKKKIRKSRWIFVLISNVVHSCFSSTDKYFS